MIKEAILKLSAKTDLSYEEAEQVMHEIMEGKASQVQMAAYLTALSMKGETTDEICASAAGMRAHCIKLLHDRDAVEIVGTGGDGANSFNISTTAAIVLASAACPSQSTETVRLPRNPAPLTFLKRLASTLSCRLTGRQSCSTGSISAFYLRRIII